MRILFVSWQDLAHPSAGGSEIVVDRLATGLLERGHETALLCGGPVGRNAYPTVSLGGTFTQYARAPFAAARFRSWDLLVDVDNGIPFFSPLWWRKPRLCLFHHIHGEQWNDYFPQPIAMFGSSLERRVVPWIYRSTDFCAVSPSTKAGLMSLGLAADRIHLLHSGIDDSMLAEPEPKSVEPSFVVLGRLAPNKAIDRILGIWERVRAEIGGRLIVVGDGPERSRLEALAPEQVVFTGRVSDERKRQLVSSAWLLVHAAPREGWGMVIMEAAAQGTPTLAFEVDGVRDSVVKDETGVLVVDDDTFAEAWVELVADTSRRAKLGDLARQRAQRFTWDATVDAFLEAAATAIGRK